MTNFRKKLEEIIRVDHAGEMGARVIYDGQIAALKLKKDFETLKIVEHMKEQEDVHFEYFDAKVKAERVRPTLMQPIWKVGGFALGFLTALADRKAGMVCTTAVEEAIDLHYQEQICEIEREICEIEREICEIEKGIGDCARPPQPPLAGGLSAEYNSKAPLPRGVGGVAAEGQSKNSASIGVVAEIRSPSKNIEGFVGEQERRVIEKKELQELKSKIEKFRKEELEHRDIGYENHAADLKYFTPLSAFIKGATRFAIAVSKKI